MNHYIWETGDTAIDGQIREALNDEIPSNTGAGRSKVPNPESLEIGDKYEGPRAGYQISVDSSGRSFEATRNSRRYITTPVIEEAANYVRKQKGGGEIIIIEEGHMFTQLPERGPVFVGFPEDGLNSIEYGESTGTLSEGAPESIEDL